jgi:hypothetical protein
MREIRSIEGHARRYHGWYHRQMLPVTALFDRNVLSWLDARPPELDVVRRAVTDGRLQLIDTHLLADELNPPDVEERDRLDALRVELQGRAVPTQGFVIGVSRLDQGTIISEDDAAVYDTLTVNNPRHAEDALLALTANREGAVLVTGDHKLIGRAKLHGIAVLYPSELLMRLRL